MCLYIISNKSNLIITTEMSVVFVYYAHTYVTCVHVHNPLISCDSVYLLWFVRIYIFTGVKYLCYYCTKGTNNTSDILRHYSTYHGEKVFTVRVRMLNDQNGLLQYRSKHFNLNSHDIANCSVDLERGTIKRPCVNEISEDCDDLEVNNRYL